jgi:hypothetical protein
MTDCSLVGEHHDWQGLSPRRASRAKGAWNKERPPSRAGNSGKSGLAIGFWSLGVRLIGRTPAHTSE